ncbi:MULTISPECIES: DUF4124 domain-containing protein [unclassified Pseudomonas]|uniref:DUF4124 domain-containing protein n=1 Tax=unclassified Pseudomonas TaxID=196821 RepID=UPI0008766C08|nr:MULTISPECIES: DUF4124 domain-containing protein [unclassified Pseudomonas]SCZ34852.1 protein of unknown function [Pseudomonas sp. NFACC44-2]SDA83060.1 protein of unknown function [Pseudomonas sp. NFACC51]SDW79310.1 protein of unknown function [Pseudomonas sp. NFACC08-1]SEJ68040.1 protein of unknown function [Pseudomonas sp. NFACC07-1]SFI86331.1 protein of unknown function [Pseudomonas sp. NFACC54]
MIRWLIALGLSLAALPGMAQVYTYIDAQGNRVFTDQPRPGNAKKVQLPPANRLPTPPASTNPPPAAEVPSKPLFHYEMLRLLIPEPDATIRSTAGELIVSVTSEPGLKKGHRYRLLLDGQPTGAPGPSPVFALSNIDRGTHQLAVEILDEQDHIVERTANQPFHMQRMSLAQKRRIKPCATADYGQRPECPLAEKPEEEKSSILPFF